MQPIREMLLKVDEELETYSLIIASARNPALTAEDRRRLVREADVSWTRLEVAHTALKRHAQRDHLSVVLNA